MKHIFLLFISVFVFVLQIESWRSFTFHFNSVQCKQKSNLTTFFNCSLTKLKGQIEGQGFNLHMQFSRELFGPKLDFIVLAQRAKYPDFVIVNFTDFDGCTFLENTGSFNILQILRKEFQKYAKLPEKCPVEKNTEIHVVNLVLDANNFPPYVPETKFRAIGRMWEKITPIFELTIDGSVDSKNRRNKNVRTPKLNFF